VELTNQEKARLARERVVRELRRRGAGQVTEVKAGDVFQLQAIDTSGRREVTLRVKTKSSGDWQTTTKIGEPREEKQVETKFWILLDTGQRGADGRAFSSCRTGGCVITSMRSFRPIFAPTVGSGP
jgi:hypothetical protein